MSSYPLIRDILNEEVLCGRKFKYQNRIGNGAKNIDEEQKG